MDEALTKPRNVTHTMYKLYNWLQMGMIDLNPEFQRGMYEVILTGFKKYARLLFVLFYISLCYYKKKKCIYAYLKNKRMWRSRVINKQIFIRLALLIFFCSIL